MKQNKERNNIVRSLPASMTVPEMIAATKDKGYLVDSRSVYKIRAKAKLGFKKLEPSKPKPKSKSKAPVELQPSTRQVEIRHFIMRYGTDPVGEVLAEIKMAANI